MLNNTLFCALITLVFAPTVSWACTCAGFSSNLNLAIGEASYVMLVKVESFVDHGAKLSVLQEFKGKADQKTIMAWGDPGFMCRSGIRSDQLSKTVVVLLHKVGDYPYNGESPEDFRFISCAIASYDVVVNKDGIQFVKGRLLTKDGSDQLKLSDLQKWADNPEEPAQLVNRAKAERLMENPAISCFSQSFVNVKKGTEKRAFVSFAAEKLRGYEEHIRVSKDTLQDANTFQIEFRDWSWDMSYEFGETSVEDKKKIIEWVDTKGPKLLVSAMLNYKKQFQDFKYQAELVSGTDAPKRLYTQDISVSREAFKERALDDPWNFQFRQMKTTINGEQGLLRYVLPMFDGYQLELVSSELICNVFEN